ncbi:MAG: PilZ domain-containing protein [Planctomycetaceae bacterium]
MTEEANKRQQKRFPVDAPILVVATECERGHVRPARIEGRTLNVSASGALIELDEAIETSRIWVRLTGGDKSLSECLVVRSAGENQYGVHFACLWSASTIRDLLACATAISE